MTTVACCPAPADLAGHAQGALAPQEAASLDRHLTRCPACLERYLGQYEPPLVSDIPNCHVVKEIGRGRFGVVYKAWWLGDKPRPVALKVLTSAGAMEQNRFERESAALKHIHSPGIVKCLDSGMAGNSRYLVMDYVEGVHLDEYLQAHQGDLSDKLRVFERVCRAVADAHAAGVVHRDLKPSNILVDADGHPHIVDFGICGVERDDWSSWDRLTITQAGDVIGTLKYMSPEQAWGREVASPIDKPSDIWALGILLHETVTDGGYPYRLGSTPDKPPHEMLLERIRKELPRIPRLDSLPRGRDLEVLIERCLTWEPSRRIDSAAELADDLERYRQGERIQTKPLGTSYRLHRLAVAGAARSRWMFLAAFVAMLGVLLWFAVFPFDVGWHIDGCTDRGFVGAPTAVEPGQARARILVAGIFDDTFPAVRDFAAKEQINEVTPAVPTWRGVHGCLMDRLALARPTAVVWDYYFRTPQAGDERFVAGVQNLEETGVPVVLAAKTYGDDGAPDISPGITEPLGERLRHGAILARDMVLRPGEFVVALKLRDQAAVPGLALATLAAVIHPPARVELDWPERRRIDLLYELPSGSYLRDHVGGRIRRDRIQPTNVFTAGEEEGKVRAGDLLACNTVPLQKPERWERNTVRYERLLTCSDEELRALVKGKVVVIGDFRMPGLGVVPDRHPVKYGASIIKDVPGCYLVADAVAGLMEGRYLRSAFPLPPATFLSMLALATVGCLIPARLRAVKIFEGPARRRWLWTGLAGLASLSFLVMVVTKNYWLVHLGMAGFSLVAPMAGAFWVEFARNRHRPLERHRLAIEDVRATADGTITLASRPLTSPRGV